MLLVVIIPCLNEEQTIACTIQAIPKQINGISRIEILVVDDGSTDNSANIARQSGAYVISHSENFGVGVAFQSGIKQALELGADIVVNIDGDGQFNPLDIPTLIQPIIDKKADFVTASRFINKDLVPEGMSASKKWGNRRIARLISLLTKKKFYDVSCGFRAYSQEALLNLNLHGKFTYTQETFLSLAFKNLAIKEIPIEVKANRQHGKSRIANNLLKYAINTSIIIFRTFRDYKPLDFFLGLAMMALVVSFPLGVFFVLHFLIVGTFSPHIWAGFVSGFFFVLALVLGIAGLLADMFHRITINQEKLLYLEKKKIIRRAKK